MQDSNAVVSPQLWQKLVSQIKNISNNAGQESVTPSNHNANKIWVKKKDAIATTSETKLRQWNLLLNTKEGLQPALSTNQQVNKPMMLSQQLNTCHKKQSNRPETSGGKVRLMKFRVTLTITTVGDFFNLSIRYL